MKYLVFYYLYIFRFIVLAFLGAVLLRELLDIETLLLAACISVPVSLLLIYGQYKLMQVVDARLDEDNKKNS